MHFLNLFDMSEVLFDFDSDFEKIFRIFPNIRLEDTVSCHLSVIKGKIERIFIQNMSISKEKVITYIDLSIKWCHSCSASQFQSAFGMFLFSVLNFAFFENKRYDC